MPAKRADFFNYVTLDLKTFFFKFLGLTNHPIYGKGKTWNKGDIERLLHKLVIEGYLQEEMHINNEIACAYIQIGGKASELMTNKNHKVGTKHTKRQ